jgi:ankyrin repeat protein
MRYFRFFIHLLVGLTISATAAAGSYEDFFGAVERDDAAAVTRLLQAGFDPNTRDPQGQVALYLALQRGAPQVAEALWRHPQLQVDLANPHGETPLMMAALKGQIDWARRLLDRGAQAQREGWSPLHYAATGPEPKLVELLLARAAPIDARSPNGSTPLMMAARYGSEASVDLLLARGADVRARNDLGLDAAAFARGADRDKLADRLAKLAATAR